MKQVEIEATLPDAQSPPFHLHCGFLLPFCLHRSMFTVSEKDISLLFHIQDLRSLRLFFFAEVWVFRNIYHAVLDKYMQQIKVNNLCCWNPWISDIFWELCFLYLHTLLSVLFDTCCYDAAYALITPVSTSHVRCCIIYHPQLKSFSMHHIHLVLACVYLVKV